MTTATKKLIQECERRGIQLEPRGQMLFVEPEENTTPEIVEQLRRHKFEIIASLEARRRAIWRHVAKQVLCGEFVGCDDLTRVHLIDGLRCFPYLLCQRALEKLKEVRWR